MGLLLDQLETLEREASDLARVASAGKGDLLLHLQRDSAEPAADIATAAAAYSAAVANARRALWRVRATVAAAISGAAQGGP